MHADLILVKRVNQNVWCCRPSIYSPDAMSDMYFSGDYLLLNPTWDAEQSPWKAKLVQDLLEKHQIVFDKLSEIGCGAGQILVKLAKIYPAKIFVGFDISPQAHELAKVFESENLQFKLCDFINGSDDKQEVVICADVFEHVDDYLGFLRSLSKKSRYTVFHIPLDISMIGVLIPEIILKTRRKVGHLHYFNRATAEATLETCGYKIIDSQITAGCLEFPDQGALGRTLWLIRKVCHYVSPSFAALLLGGFSLLVLAEST